MREIELKHKIIERLAECFKDYRKQNRIEHSLPDLLQQKIFGIALGYEDIYCARGDMENLIREALIG